MAKRIENDKAKKLADLSGDMLNLFNLTTLLVDIHYRAKFETSVENKTKQLYNVTDEGLNKNE